jgi:pimeloyl-ACP methyl ester carboxylesterase
MTTTSVRSKDGTSIGYARSGQGRALVLVHGTAADHERWKPILPGLERHFTVHALDRRGRGASEDAASYRFEDEFDDVASVVDALGEPVYLLGHSYGAICSLEAATRTRNIEKLVLYEPPIPAGVEIYSPELLERIEALLAAGDRAGVVTTFFREIVRMPAAELSMLMTLPNWPARVATAPTIARELRAHEQYHFEPNRFTALRTPTLLLLGADSPPFFRSAIDAVHAAISTSSIVVMPGQQHVAINTAPELFLREVLTFLLPRDSRRAP